ncbi:Txe/YoeB family addiction module toxin [Fusobacterium polymorphum]|jgi:addiction module toxin, txe/yoeB family|uniref:Putative mRNA interferase YoeB n=4 Tax=Fusobacterium TaxID=848 RepID=A0A0S2ZLL4_9FUSO|nr:MULTISPECIES: Txe/YoeB family addiction module toxin [Fusobacterium]ALQ38283.1 addiction module protein [Fusobacterium hwasookii ChDC F300]ALQ39663.1 addiction module protein [Fusobacterium hwasookii ChDC F174]ASG28671.1 Txe/YoeB family addiction module toxin [Fusobacterium polymorphum]EJU06822.1 Txe/YoeB family addiction module toxin [Fusobacterium hwasookii ChDC F128]ETZ31320.1 txe/YoeB family addiction module toxin [Fusobacterium nucleatum 13_3C]
MLLTWTDFAWKQYEELQEKDKRLIKKINILIKDIKRNGNEGIGKPEPLQHELSGYWSRRIDDKNRLVYKVSDNQITIVACANHYK